MWLGRRSSGRGGKVIMWKVFKAEEIIDFAVQIEKNGQKFYQALVEKTEDPELKKIFNDLAEAEAQHIIDFQSILGELKNATLNESYPGEYEEYVTSLAKDHVFTKGIEEVAETVQNPIDGIDIALRFEKDSILFFTELKELVSEDNAKTVQKLINEEKKHILRLHEIRIDYAN